MKPVLCLGSQSTHMDSRVYSDVQETVCKQVSQRKDCMAQTNMLTTHTKCLINYLFQIQCESVYVVISIMYWCLQMSHSVTVTTAEPVAGPFHGNSHVTMTSSRPRPQPSLVCLPVSVQQLSFDDDGNFRVDDDDNDSASSIDSHANMVWLIT